MKLDDVITKEDLREPYDIMTEFLEMDEIIRVAKAYAGRQVRFRRDYNDVRKDYPELTAMIGAKNAEIFIRLFSGSVGVYFPELRHNCAEKIKKLIISEYTGYNLLTLARKYGYTERHLRRLIEGKVRRHSCVDENQLTLFDAQ